MDAVVREPAPEECLHCVAEHWPHLSTLDNCLFCHNTECRLLPKWIKCTVAEVVMEWRVLCGVVCGWCVAWCVVCSVVWRGV